MQEIYSRGTITRPGRCPIYHVPWIHQVLGPELANGPAKTNFKLHSEEESYFAIDTVTDSSLKLSLGVPNMQHGVQLYGLVHLEARSRNGNILQIRNGPAQASVLLLPLNVHQVGAKHPWFGTAIIHTLHYSTDSGPGKSASRIAGGTLR